ncbi:hypothetical protein B9Z55_026906 [Caenorhabditis nigoni]|nr:hypothetical protein B9Z55_026906 [Caenorhabditis nigoni]
MDESSEVIKNSDRATKTVILYEALKKNPIFSSYRNFCKLVGEDAMEYKDFEFWYYRFYHGKMDFDYDRSMDPVPKTIMDMPISLMYKITEELDTVERSYLRTMNKPLKYTADSHPLLFDNIEIAVSNHNLEWTLNYKYFCCAKKDNGCTLQTPTKKIEIDDSFMKKGLEFLARILKRPDIQVNHLYLSVSDQTQALDELFSAPFHAKSVKLNAFETNQTFPFVLAMNPGELESIHLDSCCTADRDQILRFFEKDLARFSHLKSFKCQLNSFEPVDFQRVRDIISTFKELESCQLRYRGDFNTFPIHTVAEALGAEIPFGPLDTIKHRFPIPETNEQLEFRIENAEYSCFIHVRKLR